MTEPYQTADRAHLLATSARLAEEWSGTLTDLAADPADTIVCPTCKGRGANPANTDPCDACGGPGCYTRDEIAPLSESDIASLGEQAVDGPVSVITVAQYILGTYGPMEPIKLHCLLYYSQAWSLAIDGRPMFSEPIYARKEGPVTEEIDLLVNGLKLVRLTDLAEITTAPCGDRVPANNRYYDHVQTCDKPGCVAEVNRWLEQDLNRTYQPSDHDLGEEYR